MKKIKEKKEKKNPYTKTNHFIFSLFIFIFYNLGNEDLIPHFELRR